MGIIYKIENKITNEVYIGQTIFNLDKRWHQHIKESYEALDGKRQSFPLFHRMIIKYGENNFIPSIVEECDDDELDKYEEYWIKQYNSNIKGYNSTIGGQKNGANKVVSHPHEVSQFTLKGIFIKTFATASQAAKAVKVDASNIRRNCNGETNYCSGFLWQWGSSPIFTRKLKESNLKEQQIINKGVDQFNKDGTFIKTYKTITEAAKAVNVSYQAIYLNCKKVTKTSAGYIWKYHNEI